MNHPRPLTELEGAVLGTVWSRQPCTPYQVRRVFTDSLSPHWSGSAGAIYPLMARLETARFVRSKAHATGARQSRLYSLTPSGRAALVRWIGPPVTDEVAGVPPDPLRTRIAFIDVLPPAQRKEFLDEIEARMTERLHLSEQDHATKRAEGPSFELVARGAVAMQKARLEWIRAVKAAPTTAGASREKKQ